MSAIRVRDNLYSAWAADKAAYFGAIQAGMAGDCLPMQELIEVDLVG